MTPKTGMPIAGWPLPRLSGMQRLVSQGNATAFGAAGRTFGSLHQLPASTIGVRFELANILTENSVTYNASYALSSGANDWFTPLNADGAPDNGLWKTVTAGGLADMRVPAAVSGRQPARLLTDVSPFEDIPPERIDGGTGICLFFRMCCTAGSLTYHNFSGTVGIWNGYANGQHPGQFSQTLGGGWVNAGNHCIAGNHEVSAGPHALFAQAVPHSVLPILSTPALTIMSAGDSILCGGSSRGRLDAGINGPGLQLVKALDLPARPAMHVNEATASSTSIDFIANATNSLSIMVPDAILLQTYSANDSDPESKSTVWAAWQRSMTFAALASSAGSRVILVTSPPFSGAGSSRESGAWEAARIHANTLVRNSGLPYVDSDAILGTGLDPVSFKPDCSDDLIHPNEHGSWRLASAAASLLRAEPMESRYEYGTISGVDGRLPEWPVAHDFLAPAKFVPDGMRLFTLRTYHGTIVYVDLKRGRLRHGSDANVPRNLFAAVIDGFVRVMRTSPEGDIFTVRIRPEGPYAGTVPVTSLDAGGFVSMLEAVAFENPANRIFSINGAGLYLCAEGGGDISLNRAQAGEWERFQLCDEEVG